MSEPIHVTDAAFEGTVLQSPIPVVVDFWAPWCGPCRMVAPILEEIAKEYDGKLIVTKVNTDDNPEWAMRYGVQGIPTLLYVVNGQVVDIQVGAAPKPYIQKKIDAEEELHREGNVGEALQPKGARQERHDGGPVIYVDRSHEIPLLPLEGQIADETLRVHGEGPAEERTYSTSRAAQPDAPGDDASDPPHVNHRALA